MSYLLLLLIPFLLFLLLLVYGVFVYPYFAARSIYKKYESVARFIYGPVLGHFAKMSSSKKKYGNILGHLINEVKPGEKFLVNNLLNRPFVILTDTSLVKELLLNHHRFYKQNSFLFKELYFTHSLVSVHNEDWNRQKKILSHAMNYDFFETITPRMQAIVEKNLDKVHADHELEVYKFVFKIAAETISTCFFSKNMNEVIVNGMGLTDRLKKLINFCIEHTMSIPYMLRVGVLPSDSTKWGIFLTAKEKQVLREFEEVRKILKGEIEERITQVKAKKSDEPNRDFLEYYLRLYISPDNNLTHKISFEEIIQNFDSLLEAGSDTTSILCGMCIYCLAKYPEWQDRFAEQIKDFPENITLKDLATVPEVTYFIKEVSRFYPPAFDIFPRRSKGPVKLGEYEFPENTYIGVGVYNIMNDPKVFPEPEKFDPLRWRDPKITTFDYLTFSAGPRNCIGEQLAMIVMRMTLVLFLRRFRVELNPKIQLDMVFTSIYRSKDENLVVVRKVNKA